MKAFVINLDRDHKRLIHMSKHLDLLGLIWERIPATDVSEISEIGSRLDWPLFKSTCKPNEIGCTLSHWRIWQKIIDEGLPWALVLEDDVHFSANAASLLARLDKFAGTLRFHFIKLESFLAGIIVDRETVAVDDDYSLRRLRSNHGGTAAYLISREGCEVMIARLAKSVRPIDLEMFDSMDSSLVIYQMQPAPFIQDMFMSDAGLNFGSNIAAARSVLVHRRVWVDMLKRPLRPLARWAVSLLLLPKGKMKIKSRFG